MADEQASGTADGTPKIFRSMTGVIGGLTAIVVALGGLYTAYDKMFPKKEAPAPTATPATAESLKQNADQAPQPIRKSYATGDGGTLEWSGGMWVWTDRDGNSWRYDEISNDGVTVFGRMMEDGKPVWLQWPAGGGQALQSFDNQENWNTGIKVTVKEDGTG
jgi:hypothetical protein